MILINPEQFILTYFDKGHTAYILWSVAAKALGQRENNISTENLLMPPSSLNVKYVYL